MTRSSLIFDRPAALQATIPPEARGLSRDGVRLMVSTPAGHDHACFRDLPRFLRPGDLLVVNQSATLPASLPAAAQGSTFIVNLSTNYGRGLWLAEPRWSTARPGPLPLRPGDQISVAGLPVRVVAPYPGLPRLWFLYSEADLDTAMSRAGKPIRYGYVTTDYPLSYYQTVFAAVPGSAEMPSAGRPFTQRVLDALQACGIQTAAITLHTGVSSLEVEAENVEAQTLYGEPFQVPAATAQAINTAHSEGRRVIAIGTTVVRALESAWDGNPLCREVRPMTGFTRVYIHPGRGIHVVDGLLTGLHDPLVSHLAMLYALAGEDMIRDAYRAAIAEGYLWHEFGDSHLILPDKRSDVRHLQ